MNNEDKDDHEDEVDHEDGLEDEDDLKDKDGYEYEYGNEDDREGGHEDEVDQEDEDGDGQLVMAMGVFQIEEETDLKIENQNHFIQKIMNFFQSSAAVQRCVSDSSICRQNIRRGCQFSFTVSSTVSCITYSLRDDPKKKRLD